MLRHRRVIDVPEGLLSGGLHCRPGWAESSQPVKPGVTPGFVHTDDVPPLKLSNCIPDSATEQRTTSRSWKSG